MSEREPTKASVPEWMNCAACAGSFTGRCHKHPSTECHVCGAPDGYITMRVTREQYELLRRHGDGAPEGSGDVRVLVEALERIAVQPQPGHECEWCGVYSGKRPHQEWCPCSTAARALAAYRASLASPAASTEEKP